MPDVVSSLPGVVPAPEAEHARLGLFQAVTILLSPATEDRVVVLVIDDLHAADPPSLELLALLAPVIPHRRLVVVGALRDGRGRPTPVTERLAAIRRHAEHVPLGGLNRDAVEAMVADMAGAHVPSELVAEIHRRTEGLPLFVREFVQLLIARGTGVSDDGTLGRSVPEGIRQTIRARLAPLSPGVRGLLEQAAVLGRRFDPSLLAEMAGKSRERVEADFDDAVAVGIVEECPGEDHAYAFTHALFREGLYRELRPARRAELHGRAGRTIERRYAQQLGPRLADMAHHFLLAAPAGHVARAADYSTQAGDWAFDHLAYADAVRHYEDALKAIDALPESETRRCDILLRLGKAWFRAGGGEEARAASEKAIHVARELGDGRRLAAAAIGYAHSVLAGGLVDESRVAALEEALAMLEADEHRLRSEVLARLAMELYFADPIERADHLSQQAVEEALQQNDRRVLAETLITRHFVRWRPLGSENLSERLELGQRIQELTRTIGDPELRLRGRVWHLPNLLEGGDLTSFDRELAGFSRAAEDLRLPVYLFLAPLWRATRALLRGDFGRADHLSGEARRIAEESHAQVDIEPIATQSYGLQQYMLHRERGRLAVMEATVKATIEALPNIGGWHAGLALLYVETSRPEDARRVFEQLAVDEFRSLREDAVWLNAMASLAAVCAELGDAARAKLLYERIRPYAASHVVIGWAVGYLGSVAHYLGQLASTMQRFDDAAAHFAHALRAHRRMAAAPWVARTEYHFAEALLARGGPTDLRPARAMAASALHAARSLGMEQLSRRAERLVARLQEKAPGTGRRRETGTFRRDGEYWTLSLGDETVLLRDAKGLRYLAILLRSPGRELHVLDLVAAADGVGTERVRRAVAADADLVPDRYCPPQGPDQRARRAYSQRIKELEAEITQSRAAGELERAATLEEEQQLLAGELARVFGIGRTRASPHVERARIAVTNAVRRSIERMRNDAPVLARHFDRAITTGIFCSYTPGDDERVSWETERSLP